MLEQKTLGGNIARNSEFPKIEKESCKVLHSILSKIKFIFPEKIELSEL